MFFFQPAGTGAGDPDSSIPLSPLYLVELSAVTPSGQDTIESEMRAFADHLKPYPCSVRDNSEDYLCTLTNKKTVLLTWKNPTATYDDIIINYYQYI